VKLKKKVTAFFEPEYDPNVFRTIFNVNEDKGRASFAMRFHVDLLYLFYLTRIQ